MNSRKNNTEQKPLANCFLSCSIIDYFLLLFFIQRYLGQYKCIRLSSKVLIWTPPSFPAHLLSGNAQKIRGAKKKRKTKKE